MPQTQSRVQPATPRRPKVKGPAPDRQYCRRCGRLEAQIIGRSESYPVVYLRCDGCQLASVTPA